MTKKIATIELGIFADEGEDERKAYDDTLAKISELKLDKTITVIPSESLRAKLRQELDAHALKWWEEFAMRTSGLPIVGSSLMGRRFKVT